MAKFSCAFRSEKLRVVKDINSENGNHLRFEVLDPSGSDSEYVYLDNHQLQRLHRKIGKFLRKHGGRAN